MWFFLGAVGFSMALPDLAMKIYSSKDPIWHNAAAFLMVFTVMMFWGPFAIIGVVFKSGGTNK